MKSWKTKKTGSHSKSSWHSKRPDYSQPTPPRDGPDASDYQQTKSEASQVFKRALNDWANADRVERRWLKGGRISKEDLLKGNDPIERVTSEEWFKIEKPQWSSPQGATMGFGKYKDKTIAEVYRTNRWYIEWAIKEVNGFKDRPEVKRLPK